MQYWKRKYSSLNVIHFTTNAVTIDAVSIATALVVTIDTVSIATAFAVTIDAIL